MGETIRSGAAADDIVSDVRDTLSNAGAKEGIVKKLAEDHLAPVLAMIDVVEADVAKARTVVKNLKSALSAENAVADATIARVYDDVWNDVDRPASDRYLSLIFPGGTGYYAEGDVNEQPQRMELLARFFDKRLHPKLSKEQADAYAKRIREAAQALQVDVDALKAPAIELELLERTYTALARLAQGELVNLKRSYKNAGMTEAQIHTIIPDRPAPKKKPKATKEGEDKTPKKPEEGKKPDEPAKPQ